MKVISKHGMMSDDCLEIHGHTILTTFILSKLIPKLNISTSAAINVSNIEHRKKNATLTRNYGE